MTGNKITATIQKFWVSSAAWMTKRTIHSKTISSLNNSTRWKISSYSSFSFTFQYAFACQFWTKIYLSWNRFSVVEEKMLFYFTIFCFDFCRFPCFSITKHNINLTNRNEKVSKKTLEEQELDKSLHSGQSISNVVFTCTLYTGEKTLVLPPSYNAIMYQRPKKQWWQRTAVHPANHWNQVSTKQWQLLQNIMFIKSTQCNYHYYY